MAYPVVPVVPVGQLNVGDPVTPTNVADVKAANTSPTLADSPLVTAISPNNTGLPVNVPAILQKANAVSTGSVASLAKAFTNSNVAGNSIVVVAACGNGTAMTVTDSAGNTYNAVNNAANGTTFSAQIFWATGILAGANTVTVTPSASVSVAMEIYEISGLLAQVVAQPDQNITNTGTGTVASTTNIVPGHPNEIFFAGVAVGTAAQTVTPAGGWTNDSGQQNVGGTPSGLFSFVSLSQFRPGLGTVSPDATLASSEPWAMAVASFRPVALNISGTVSLTSNNTGLPVNVPAIVQKANAASTGSVASLAKAFVNNNIAGNSIVVVCGAGNNGTLTVTDTNGNTYTSAIVQANSTTFEAQIFYAVGIVGGANTITVTNGGATASIALEIYEVSGLITQVVAQPDQTTSGTGTSAAPAISTLAPSSPNSLAFLGVAVGTAAQAVSATSGTNWTLDSTQNPTTATGLFTFGSLSQFLSTTTPVVPKATLAGSEPFAAVCAIFKPVVLGVQGIITQDGYNYTHITTDTTTLIKTGPGILHAIIINSHGASATIEMDDALTHTTPVIGIITLPSTITSAIPISLEYDIKFSTGLSITTGTATLDITVVWK